MTMSGNEKGNFSSPTNTLVALGLGVLLAPVTGGASLAYTACHIGAAAAVDAYEANKKEDDKKEDA